MTNGETVTLYLIRFVTLHRDSRYDLFKLGFFFSSDSAGTRCSSEKKRSRRLSGSEF